MNVLVSADRRRQRAVGCVDHPLKKEPMQSGAETMSHTDSRRNTRRSYKQTERQGKNGARLQSGGRGLQRCHPPNHPSAPPKSTIHLMKLRRKRQPRNR